MKIESTKDPIKQNTRTIYGTHTLPNTVINQFGISQDKAHLAIWYPRTKTATHLTEIISNCTNQNRQIISMEAQFLLPKSEYSDKLSKEIHSLTKSNNHISIALFKFLGLDMKSMNEIEIVNKRIYTLHQ